MKTIFILFGSIGAIGFVVSTGSLFMLWVYFILRITGYCSASAEQDAMARKLGALFGKLFGLTIAYSIVYIVVAKVIGPPH